MNGDRPIGWTQHCAVLAGALGPDVIIYNEQINAEGRIDVTTALGGDIGYDAVASATASSNAATGYACSECRASLKADNYRTNSADVSARARTTLGGPSRSAIGNAAAVGNNASYYVSAPTTATQ